MSDPLREAIDPGDSGHIGDHEALHARHNQWSVTPRQGGSGSGSAPLTSDYATPLTGDLDIRYGIIPDTYDGLVPAAMGDFNGGDGGDGWVAWGMVYPSLILFQSGVMSMYQATAPDLTLAGPEQPTYQRITLDRDNGAGGATLTFYTSADEGQTWDQLGDPVVEAAGSITIDVTTHPLTGLDDSGEAVSFKSTKAATGSILTGLLLWLEVRNGIGGTVVADPDFRVAPWAYGDSGPHDDGQGVAWEWPDTQGAIDVRPVTGSVFIATAGEDPGDPTDWSFLAVQPKSAGLAQRVTGGTDIDLSATHDEVAAIDPAAIPTLAEVPASFADLAAVQTYLAALVAGEEDSLAVLVSYLDGLTDFLMTVLTRMMMDGFLYGHYQPTP